MISVNRLLHILDLSSPQNAERAAGTCIDYRSAYSAARSAIVLVLPGTTASGHQVPISGAPGAACRKLRSSARI